MARSSIAALAIVDANGLEQLTMRRLGAELGVDPMTIYGHVPDKAALFDGLVELVLTEIEVPAVGGAWEDDLRAVAYAARATWLAHPYVIPLLGTRPPVTESSFAPVEAVTSILLGAGLTEQQAADGFDGLARLLIGHALAQAGRRPVATSAAVRKNTARPSSSCPRSAIPPCPASSAPVSLTTPIGYSSWA